MNKWSSIFLGLILVLAIFVRLYWFQIGEWAYERYFSQNYPDPLQGFVLYYDEQNTDCESCFAELQVFEIIQTVYPEVDYQTIIGLPKASAEETRNYYCDLIRSNIFESFNCTIRVDEELTFKKRFQLSEGTKVLFFNQKQELVFVSNIGVEMISEDYLKLVKNFW